MDLIRLHGMEPSVRLTDERWVDCEAAEGLAQGSTLKTCGEPLLRLERVFCGDGKPVLYSLAYYRKSNFKFDYQKWKDFEDLSLCEFLEIFCLRQANTTVAELDFARYTEPLPKSWSWRPAALCSAGGYSLCLGGG